MLERLRIVLVRPIRSGNVGAVCRAMTNFGLSDLVLVAPRCDYLDAQGTGFAARALPRLEAARVVESIPDALADCVHTFATSAKGGFYRRNAAIGAAEGARLAVDAAAAGPVAVAFGPEDRGLVLDELLHFDRVIEIPTAPQYPALNLAAAVTILAYELFLASPTAPPAPGSPVQGASASNAPAHDAPALGAPARTTPAESTHGAHAKSAQASDARAVGAQKRVMFERLFGSLERIGFFRNQQYENHLRLGIRHMLGRLDLSANEADILLGIARQIAWYADHPASPARTAEPDQTDRPRPP
jgi:TrmH family RNA methyltransferase